MDAKQTAEALAMKQHELKKMLDSYSTGQMDPVTGNMGIDLPDGKEAEIVDRQKEIQDLTDQYKRLALDEIRQKNEQGIHSLSRVERQVINAGGNPTQAGLLSDGRYSDQKTVGQMVANSYNYQKRGDRRGGFACDLDNVDVKTLLTTGGAPGFTPPNYRTDLIVPFANRRPVVADLMPNTNTSVGVVYWMEEVTFTNNASQIGEGANKLESSLDWDQKSATIQKIATWVQATMEQIDDVPQLQSLIDNDLMLMLRLQEENQLVNGNNVGSNLNGFLTAASQTQSFVTSNADTLFKAMTKVSWTGYASASAIIMNPNNWETTRLSKGTTNDMYYLGSPMIDIQSPRLWGVPVIVTNVITAGTAIVGDFVSFSEIFRRMGIRIDVSDSHASNFIANITVIRAELREALVVKRGAAFVVCSGLT